MFIALFIITIVFFSTLAIAQNIRDAKKENIVDTEPINNPALQSDAPAL